MTNNDTLKKRRVMIAMKRPILKKHKIVPKEPQKRKGVFLTFDDGPDKKYTPKILDILNDFSAKATFFLVGKKVRSNPNIVKRIINEGHDIGNHTYSHPVSPVFKYKKIEREIRVTDKIVKRITGKKMRLFRPTWGPWDMHSKKMLKIAKYLGYYSIRWSISSVDWLGMKKVIRHKLSDINSYSREILLFHDGAEKSPFPQRDATVELLPEILETLHRKRISTLKLSSFIPDGV